MSGELQVFQRQAAPAHDPSKVSVRKTLPRTPDRGFHFRTPLCRYLPDRKPNGQPDQWFNAELAAAEFAAYLQRHFETLPRVSNATYAARQIARIGRQLRLAGCPLECKCAFGQVHEGQCGVLTIIRAQNWLRRMGVAEEHLAEADELAERMLRENKLTLRLEPKETAKPFVTMEDLGL